MMFHVSDPKYPLKYLSTRLFSLHFHQLLSSLLTPTFGCVISTQVHPLSHYLLFYPTLCPLLFASFLAYRLPCRRLRPRPHQQRRMFIVYQAAHALARHSRLRLRKCHSRRAFLPGLVMPVAHQGEARGRSFLSDFLLRWRGAVQF
jgi:hypothetical protein